MESLPKAADSNLGYCIHLDGGLEEELPSNHDNAPFSV